MAMLKNLLKTGVAMKALNIAKREAAKPENQRKAKELFAKVMNRGGNRTGYSRRPPR